MSVWWVPASWLIGNGRGMKQRAIFYSKCITLSKKLSPPAMTEHLSFPQKQLLLPEIPQLSLKCGQVCQAPDLNPFSLVIFSLSSLSLHKLSFFPWLLLKACPPQGQACMRRAAPPLFHPRVFFQTSSRPSRCNSKFVFSMYQIYVRVSLCTKSTI